MECPEEFTQGELTSNNWHLGLKIIIAVLIVGVSVLCVVMKLIFGLWLCWLNWKQNTYLDTLDADEDEAEDKLQVRRMMDSLRILRNLGTTTSYILESSVFPIDVFGLVSHKRINKCERI